MSGPTQDERLRITATRLMETLNDLYGHTFDLIGIEAIRHSLAAYAQAENERLRSLIREVPEWLVPMGAVTPKMPYRKFLKKLNAALRSVETGMEGGK